MQNSTIEISPQTGREIFMTKCASCHQSDGNGIPGICAPLATSPRLAGPQENLVRILLLGMKGPQIRDGITYNGIMPAWRFDLSDVQIAAVLNDMLARWNSNASPISSEFVKGVRDGTASENLFITPNQLDSKRAK